MPVEWKSLDGPVHTRAIVAPGLELSVSYEGLERLPGGAPQYNVFVFGKRLKTRSSSLEKGQYRAMQFAITVLKHGLETLTTENS